MKRSWFVLALMSAMLLSIETAKAQERICLSHEHELSMREKYPQLGTKEQFEARFSKLIETVQVQRAGLPEVITIPIIFHIIHDGEEVGDGDNLSSDLIYAQLDQLNADFRREPGTSGFNNNPVGADTNIEFALALLDPEGNLLEEPGINRIDRNDKNWTAPPYDGINSNYIDEIIKPESYWNPDLYFNFWSMNLPGDFQGYAQFPSLSTLGGMPEDGGAAETDGIVVVSRSIGSSELPNPRGLSYYDEGKTATHEVGHWLGLRHIWGDGGCGVDDFVDDTPLQGFSSSGCPSDQDSCTGDSVPDMVENYMDYSADRCMNTFTLGQKARMETVMTLSPRRASLLESTVHLAPFPRLIISEIVDGTEQVNTKTEETSGVNPRYIEIHNADDEAYDLSTLTLRIYNDGDTQDPAEVTLNNGTILDPNNSFVISSIEFDPSWGGAFLESQANLVDPAISGDGNDVYELFDSNLGIIVDRFGELGQDGLGTDWEYVDGTVRRNSYVISANFGNFSTQNWTFGSYSSDDVSPGDHLAETPAFDPVLLELVGVEFGEKYYGCEGSVELDPAALFLNRGTAAISSIAIEINNNGTTSLINATFDPVIAPRGTGTFELDGFTLTQGGDYSYSVDIADELDGNPTNNKTAAAEYEAIIFESAYSLSVETQTDIYPEELSWTITNTNGDLFAESGEFESVDLEVDNFCLEDGDYIFTFRDSWGDGFFGGYSELYLGDYLLGEIPGNHPNFNSTTQEDPKTVTIEFSLPFKLPPAIPTDVICTPIDQVSIDIAWTDNAENEDNYVIERAPFAQGPWTTLSSDLGVDATAFSDSGLEPGTTYYYRVKAIHDTGESDWSMPGVATTESIILSADQFGNGISIYPNPTRDKLYINLEQNPNTRISLTDLSGRKMNFENSTEGNNIVLDLSHLPTGLYLINLDELSYRVFKK